MTNEELIANLVSARTLIDGVLKELVPEQATDAGGDCKHEQTEDVGGAGGASRKVCVKCKAEVD